MTAAITAEIQSLQSTLEARGVRYAFSAYVDVHGVSKGKMVPIQHLDRMLGGSELFTGAALDGVPQAVSDDEVAAMPDAANAIVLPWKPEVAWFPSDLHLHGRPFEACSRSILKRQLAQATQMGFRFNLGIETEFYILKDDEHGEPVPAAARDTHAKPCYDLRLLLDNFGPITELVEAMNTLGWDVYSFDHEDANGQFETDFMYADALTMTDRFVFFRFMANEIARKHGYYATFMPKPFENRTGSGAHYNMSLADVNTGANLFETDADPRGCGISKLAYQFIAGVLRHGAAISAVIAPTVNSYKRLVRQGSMSGFTWAPVFICYGNNNRTNMIRVPMGGGRIECRAADIACNPYLGTAMVLAAGLEGIREGLDPGDPHRENMYLYSEAELKRMGVSWLPRNLDEAIDAFEADPLSRAVFGDLMFQSFVDFKRQEWREYHNHVSDWERQRYLKFF
ncbi:MAG: type III glutamate--ammonia ligase [Gammaproteobacteria bacterium]|nr:type III glutamate--ammonia ligase [Gammaproteobacteria bacterium]